MYVETTTNSGVTPKVWAVTVTEIPLVCFYPSEMDKPHRHSSIHATVSFIHIIFNIHSSRAAPWLLSP